MKKLIFSLAFVSLSLISFAQVITPFHPKFNVTQKGGIVYLANTATGCGSSATGCDGHTCAYSHNELPPGGSGVDNSFEATYVDVDNDATTWMSSSDSLALPNCSLISFAGLYWGAGGNTGDPTGSHWSTRSQCEIKLNNGSYIPLTADTVTNNNIGYESYHCFKNITSIVAAGGPNGRYTIANMPILNDNGSTENRWGGWVIVVVYRNDFQSVRNLTVFNGLSNVSSNHTTTNIGVHGFLTPPTGPVTFELGEESYDGDRGASNSCSSVYRGDSLTFKSAGAFIPVSDAIHPANDVFNSTIANNGVLNPYRNPSYNNTLGMDANIFAPVNTSKNYITNNATTATLHLTTGGETYLTQVVTMAIDAYEPDLRGALSVRDVNGGLVLPGDTLEYTMTVYNIGSDNSINTYISDTLGANAVYVPNSIRITYGENIGNKTDAAGDDQADYFTGANALKVRVGTGATGSVGGSVAFGGADSTQIKFRVTATTNCTSLLCNNTINDLFWVHGTGQISGDALIAGSNPTLLNSNGCPISGSQKTVINAQTCGGPTVSNNSPICAGGTINLTVSTVSGATSYVWTGPNGYYAATQNPSITNSTVAMSGTYTVTIYSNPSCAYVATTSVTVNSSPSVNSVSNQTICSGANTTEVVFSGSAAGTIYTWTNNNTATGLAASGTGNIPSFTGVNTGTTPITSTITVTPSLIACGNGTPVTFTITVNPSPVVGATASSSSVCAGNSVTLTGSGASSYSWTGGVTNGQSFVPSATGTYTVTGTNGNTCSNTASVTVTVNQLPQVGASASPTTVCAGGSVILTGSGANSYSWTGGVTNGQSFVPSATGTYTVTGTSENTCSNTASVTVTVNQLPQVGASASPTTVCAGGSVILTGSGAISYSWTGGVTNGQSFVPSATGTYTVTGTGENTCSNTASVTVTVNQLPQVGASASPSTVCAGTSVTLTGSGASSYSWTGGVTNGQSFVPSATGTYTVTGTSENCSNTASVTVTVNQLPQVGANASSSTVCAGTSVILTGSGASSYSWTGGITDGQSFVPSATGTYTVTGTDDNTCSNTAAVTVTVNQLPQVGASASPATVCAGTSVTLTGSGATSYSWTGGVTDGQSFVPSATGSYTVTGTDDNTCSNTAAVTVTVNQLPQVGANASSSTVCAGTSVTLTGSGASSYSWTGGVTDGQSFVPSATGSYTVTGTDDNTCSNTAAVTVTVNQLPQVGASASPATVCAGSPVTLNGSGATSYSWTGGVTDGQSFVPSATGSYTVTGTDDNTCSNTAAVTVTVNQLPQVGANASSTSSCNGSSVILTGSGASSYSWSDGVTDGQSFVPSATETYTVTGTDDNTCSNTATVTVTVGTLTITANASSPSVCTGNSVTLTGGGAGNYTWTGGVTDGQPFVPASTDTYTVTASNSNGCIATASVTVTVNQLPQVGASASSTTVCSGTSVYFTGTGATNYSWTGGVIDNTPFTPASSGSYTVTGTDGNSCSNTASVTVTVNQLPTVNANASPATVCAGTTVTVNGSGATNYSWSGGVSDNTPFTPTSSGSYTVTGTDGNSCSNTASVTVTVNQLPTVNANASAPSVCAGSPVTLTGSGATNYSWSGGVSDNTAFTPVSTGTYTVTGTDGNSCSNTASVTVTVNQLPTVGADASSNTVCAGTTVTLNGSGASSYSWSGGVSNNTPFTPASSGSYTVTGTDGNSCSNTASVSITVNSLPAVNATASPATVCAGSSTTLTGSGNATSYSWSGGVSDGVSFIPAGTATYTVTGTDDNSCSNTASVTVTVGAMLPAPTINTNSPICDGGNIELSTPQVIGATYNWSGTNSFSSSQQNPTITGVATGTYTYTLTLSSPSFTCGSTPSTVTVTVNAIPSAPTAGSNSPVCMGTDINLTAGGAAGGTYIWTGPGYTSSNQNPTINGAAATNAGTYSVTVSVAGCTSAPTTTDVTVNDCGADLSITKVVNNSTPVYGGTVVFTITVTNNGPADATGVVVTEVLPDGYSYSSSTVTAGTYDVVSGLWTIGNLANGTSQTMTVTVTVVKYGNYTNTATVKGDQNDVNPLNNSASASTVPGTLTVYQGFSPNHDGVNDTWVIEGIENYPNNSVKIFNRWGDLVFTEAPYKNDWAGNNNQGLNVGGNELPIGTYFYLIDLGDGSPVLKGTVYLNR